MQKRLVVSVYGGLLVKDYGQNVGFCYRAVTNGDHTFMPGFWYGSCGDLTSKLIKAIKDGVPEINPAGVWVLSRPCNYGGMLDRVRDYVGR